MNKYSYIAILVAVLIGVVAGSFFTKQGDKKDFELERRKYTQYIKAAEKDIVELNKVILQKDSILKIDSISITTLNKKVEASRVKTQKKREEIKKLNSSEKEVWFIDRYPLLGSKGDSVTIPDTIAAAVMDDLILKDGLVDEVQLKDSIIFKYVHRDSIQGSIIATHELKDIKQDSIMYNQNEIIKSHVQEKKELKRELRKEKVNKVAHKVLIIGQAILIIALTI